MIPDKVTFSDIGDIDPATLLHPRIFNGTPPLDWMRVIITREEFTDVMAIDRWCGKNLQGRWARHTSCFYYDGKWRYFMWFQSTVDAVFFKMSGDEPFEVAT